ncbi:hypothetical protein BHM03_00060276 [Ensete ventricosum]|nr:hypothetical protein BHM03_00060276 [Ensete ventricosum]
MHSRCWSSRRRHCSLALGTPPRPPLIGLKQTQSMCSFSRVSRYRCLLLLETDLSNVHISSIASQLHASQLVQGYVA